ncbi:GPALPP motifs-containing protein 1 [Latimeria chalumnae]|uniref:GPALPP motifs-containing protein 1 n=1 Tax=Latimeria chalumnae TaxID=7897 RepID=H3AQX9_LATCH|nr:PREDICTED: GPALPP motifs-containing protein 1 [Latimeria chalumnae]|eukprot:XP_006006660.1 PREDICTED: GPALPP motifs-containing protein 1 [Latimeria chalumnae]
MSNDIIGPALPPGFKTKEDEDSEEVAGPALPPGYKLSDDGSDSSDQNEEDGSIGPALPPGFRKLVKQNSEKSKPSKKQKVQEVEDDDDDNGFFGPALPPGFKKREESPERPIIGPALPPGFKKSECSSDEDDDGYVGLGARRQSTSTDSDEEDEVIGPMPSKGPVESTVATEFERRARRMKEKLTSGDDESKQLRRESWMTELPPELKSFGLGPRAFKRRADTGSGDRSVWTDTPADREQKAREREEGKLSSTEDRAKSSSLSERDKRLAEKVSSYNESQRSESLLDMHQKKLKRKAEEGKDEPKERRPFDRDQDLRVHQFDEAQKKSLIKRSKELNSRFSHSKGSMFL